MAKHVDPALLAKLGVVPAKPAVNTEATAGDAANTAEATNTTATTEVAAENGTTQTAAVETPTTEANAAATPATVAPNELVTHLQTELNTLRPKLTTAEAQVVALTAERDQLKTNLSAAEGIVRENCVKMGPALNVTVMGIENQSGAVLIQTYNTLSTKVLAMYKSGGVASTEGTATPTQPNNDASPSHSAAVAAARI